MPKMTDGEFEALVSSEIQEAETYISRDVAIRRERNYDYFMAAADPDRMLLYLPVAKGQSRALSTDVSDYIGMLMPNLMRTVAGGRKLFDFQAKGDTDREAARVATDFINDVVMRFDNQGEAIIRQWGLDGLVQITGIVKVWWEEKEESEEYEYKGVTEEVLVQAAQKFLTDPTIKVDAIEKGEDGSYTVKATRTFNKSHCCFDVVPPEEFLINRTARSMEDARIKFHRTFRRVGELIDMGIKQDVIESLPSFDQASANIYSLNQALRGLSNDSEDEMLREVAVYEGVVLCNRDGKGLKEWYVLAGGSESSVVILQEEPFKDQVYFCDFCPEPLPSMFFGKCPADELVENQNQQTMLKRGLLTNIYFGNSPQREVVSNLLHEGAADQLLSPVPNGLVFVKAMGAIREVPSSSNAGVTLEAIQYVHSEAERRVGITQRSAGLKPDQINGQSATEAMIDHNASLGQVEDYARIWATGGLRKLGRAILRIIKRYQSFDRMIEMNGQVAPVNPQAWAEFEDWDCLVNTGLGTGKKERDSQVIQGIVAKQEQIFQFLGPENPLVSLDQYATALRDAVEIDGLDPDRYFKVIQPGQQVQMPPKPPDPKLIEAQQRMQLETQKAQTDAALKKMAADQKAAQDKETADRAFQLDIEKMNRESLLKREEMAREHELRKEEMQDEYDLKLISIATKSGNQSTNIPRPN
jgi:hypothetical protein